MSIKSFVAGAAAVLILGAAGTGNATMVAGWDFSQYLDANLLTINGSDGANTLGANYSDLDPSGLGPDSGVFGTMYINGEYGSSFVDPFGAAPAFVPVGINLNSNLGAPADPIQFNQLTSQIAEGALFANELGMVNQSAVQVVFGANLLGSSGTDWGVSFGGRTISGAADIQIEFSTDGQVWYSFGSVSLNTVDSPFSVALGTAATDSAFVRLTFASPSATTGAAVIDNLAITTTVPEPAAMVLVGLGLALVSGLRRRHAQI